MPVNTMDDFVNAYPWYQGECVRCQEFEVEMSDPDRAPIFSVVVPLFNEEEVISAFHDRLSIVMLAMGAPWEVIYVDDGSTDTSARVISGLVAPGGVVRAVRLSRNFGKEIAMTAGLDRARGQATIIIDVDLQDPPEVIFDLAGAWRDGIDVAYAQRTHRDGETWLKKMTSSLFYRVMRHVGGRVVLPADTGDFRILSRRAVDALVALREQHRFMKGLYAWVGFTTRAVPYRRDARAAGMTKWNYLKLIDLSIEGITSFTTAPLRLATVSGIVSATFAVFYGVFIIVRTLMTGNDVPGYPSLLVAVLFFGGLQLLTLGIIGEYIGRIFNETKRRPLYVVSEESGASCGGGVLLSGDVR